MWVEFTLQRKEIVVNMKPPRSGRGVIMTDCTLKFCKLDRFKVMRTAWGCAFKAPTRGEANAPQRTDCRIPQSGDQESNPNTGTYMGLSFYV